uniref:Uncharacterized protein n=1 Tax=Hyaloperonospora arabidopsidis (strain Emoy2) TaxID=559515 RepID=M4B6Q8_HYAAE
METARGVVGWVTLNRVRFASKHIRVVLLPSRIFGLPTSENIDTTNWKIAPGHYLARSARTLNTTQLRSDAGNLTGLKYKIARRLKWVRRLTTQVPHFWHKPIKADRGDSGRAPTKNTRSSEEFPPGRHQSLQRSSLASSQVHLEECSRPNDGYTR